MAKRKENNAFDLEDSPKKHFVRNLAEDQRKDLPYKVVTDLDLGKAAEFPLSILERNINGFIVLDMPVVFQCPKCLNILPHKYDAIARWIRIQICPRHSKKEVSHDKAS